MSNEFEISVRKDGIEKYEKYYVRSEALEEIVTSHTEHIRLRYFMILKFVPVIIIIFLCIFSYLCYKNIINEGGMFKEENKVTTNIEQIEVYVCQNEDTYNRIEINDATTRRNFWKKLSFNQILAIIYFSILIATIISLFIIFITDDTNLKYTKLDELHDVKQKILRKKFVNSIEEKTEYYNSKNNQSNVQKVVSKKHNDAELLKHYMTCITEL